MSYKDACCINDTELYNCYSHYKLLEEEWNMSVDIQDDNGVWYPDDPDAPPCEIFWQDPNTQLAMAEILKKWEDWQMDMLYGWNPNIRNN